MGRKVGIDGARSSLIGEVLRLLEGGDVPWLVLENVPFLMSLGQGAALTLITTALTELGYRWAYRVVDTNAFGLPQRRNRWYLVASRVGDPRDVLLADDVARPEPVATYPDVACGFYWTEGMRAFGWAVDGVPPIKCGSSVGVASPPAIRMPSGAYVTPDLRDTERLQGFPADWTAPAEEVAKRGERWRMVGNSVSVPVATWIGERLASPGRYSGASDVVWTGAKWPRRAAWADLDGVVHAADVGPWPRVAAAAVAGGLPRSPRRSRCRRGPQRVSCAAPPRARCGSRLASSPSCRPTRRADWTSGGSNIAEICRANMRTEVVRFHAYTPSNRVLGICTLLGPTW